jgi:hypothetical protein
MLSPFYQTVESSMENDHVEHLEVARETGVYEMSDSDETIRHSREIEAGSI